MPKVLGGLKANTISTNGDIIMGGSAQIKNLADGSVSSDGVNIGQITSALNNFSLNDAYDGGTSIITDVGSVIITGGQLNSNSIFQVKDTSGGVTVLDITGNNIIFGRSIGDNMSMGFNKILKLGDGVDPNDAVNFSQLETATNIDLQDAYDNGIQPQITTNDTDLALIIQNAQTLDTSTQLEIKNIAGTITSSITGDGDLLLANGKISSTSGIINIGFDAGDDGSSNNALNIGYQSGKTNQGGACVNVGYRTGYDGQDQGAVAVGWLAGSTDQKGGAVALGLQAAETNQGIGGIAIGNEAGQTDQNTFAIAIGVLAGETGQGQDSIAIGAQAGRINQPDNSISINGTGNILIPPAIDSTVISPFRDSTAATGATKYLQYNDTTKELIRDPIINLTAQHATGVLSGGLLTINADTTKFDISDGNGTIVDPTTQVQTNISWSGLTAQTPTAPYTGILTYVFIDSLENSFTQSTKPTAAQIRDNIFLGVLVHVSPPNLTVTNDGQMCVLSAANQLRDLCSSIGFINVDGNLLSAPTANLKIAKSNGNMFAFGSNFKNDVKNPHIINLPAIDTSGAGIFQYRFQDGTSSALTLTDIIPNILDNGTAYPGSTYATNKWGVCRVFSFTSNALKLQAPQFSYNTAADAKSAIPTEGYVFEPSLLENGLLIGYLVVRGGATNLQLSADAVFLQTGKFGAGTTAVVGSTATLQNTYNNSIQPQVETSTSLAAVQFKRGSAADTDTVIEVLNGAGTSNFSVSGNGDIVSNDVNCSEVIMPDKVHIGSTLTSAQGTNAIAIGRIAGNDGQLTDAIAIGELAGSVDQGIRGIAIGRNAGLVDQKTNAVAIGWQAGETNQGTNSTAIGNKAGKLNQGARSIILNGTGADLDNTNADSTTIAPIRTQANVAGLNLLYYNDSTNELATNDINATPPTNNTSAGVKGEIRIDSTYIYYCIGTSSWARVAIGGTW